MKGKSCVQKLPGLVRFITTNSRRESLAQTLYDNKKATPTCFRTSESNPANHTSDQCGLFYTVPQEEATIFQHGGLTKPFMEQCSTFTETSFMIRKPAIEILSRLKSTDFSNPPNKFVLYGPPGVGKSLVMAHVLHYASTSKWLLLHVPWVGGWLRSPKRFEVVNSTTRPGCVDLPESAVKWLYHFKTQNAALVKELDLRISADYEWSKREVSKAGDPLMDIVELGLSRSRHACEVIIALVQEIKGFCIADKCKALVAIDGFNGFFHPNTRVKNELKQVMPPEKVSFVSSFMSTTNPDWHNSAAILTCDEMVVPGHDGSPLPHYQLTLDGFHHLNPFIPINVPAMSDAELRNTLAYYKDRRWLQETQGDDELVFLCGGNPYKLRLLCDPL